ncbi:hypothetical protein D3C85_1378420 [compost metagenome]
MPTAITASHETAHAAAKKIPLEDLAALRSTIEQALSEGMASDALACMQAETCQVPPLTSQPGNHEET